MADYVDEILEMVDGDPEQAISGLVEVGALTEVGAASLRREMGIAPSDLRSKLTKALRSRAASGGVGGRLPAPPFARSARETERRAPLGFVETGTGAFFSLSRLRSEHRRR